MSTGKSQIIEGDFAERFRAARLKRGLTQEQVAEMLKVSNGAVGTWETGPSIPGSKNLSRICALLDVSAEYLLNGKEEAKTSALETREKLDSNETKIWRERVKALELELAELKGGMRALLDRSNSSSLKAKKEGVMAVFQTLTREQQQEVLELARRIQENKT